MQRVKQRELWTPAPFFVGTVPAAGLGTCNNEELSLPIFVDQFLGQFFKFRFCADLFVRARAPGDG